MGGAGAACIAMVDMAAVRLAVFVFFLDFEIGGAVFVGVMAFIVAV